jgi:hypothetical protein
MVKYWEAGLRPKQPDWNVPDTAALEREIEKYVSQ